MKYDITGQKFGKLTVLGISGKRNSSNDILWECKCDCGGVKNVISGALRHGMTKSCGCMMGSPKHGDWNKRIRIIWVNMMRRCYREKDKQYPDYGGRGILVYKKWHDYQVFKKWAYDNGYQDILTIDRIKVNKSYTPKNCRWATHKEQNNNRRNNTKVQIGFLKNTVAQWCDLYGIKQSQVWKRYTRGWDLKKAIITPIRNYPKK
jgi:hypothetical protein